MMQPRYFGLQSLHLVIVGTKPRQQFLMEPEILAAAEAETADADGDEKAGGGRGKVPSQRSLREQETSALRLRMVAFEKIWERKPRKPRDTDSHPLSFKSSTDIDDVTGEISAALATGDPPPLSSPVVY